MTVRIKAVGRRFAFNLTAAQSREFSRELAEVKRRKFWKGLPRQLTLAPDCIISVRMKSGRTKHYELYGRTVLLDLDTNRTWQFYFGLRILEWLHFAMPRQTKVPFPTQSI